MQNKTSKPGPHNNPTGDSDTKTPHLRGEIVAIDATPKKEPLIKLNRSQVKRILIYAAVIIVALAGITTLVVIHIEHEASDVCSTGHNIQLLEEFGRVNATNIAQQQSIVGAVQQLPKYDRDPNCLYTVVNYYINTSNPQKATNYFNQLQKVYNPKVGFNKALGSTLTIEMLKNSINTLNSNAKQIEKHVILVSPTQ